MKYFTILVAIVVVLLLAYYFKPSFIYNTGSVQGSQVSIQNGAVAASAGQAPSGLPRMDAPAVVDPAAGGQGGSVTDLASGERVIREAAANGMPTATDAVDINTQVINSSMSNQDPLAIPSGTTQTAPVNNPPLIGGQEMNALANDATLAGVRLASCYPKEQLTAEELLPQENFASQWAQTYPTGQGTLKDKNFLQAGHHIGINTVGQTLRNANLQLRSEPPCPQVQVSPWLQSTISPDLNRRVFEVGSC